MLGAQQARQFDRDGYLVVRRALDSSVLEPVRQHIADYVDHHIRRLIAEGRVANLRESTPFAERWALVCRENGLTAVDGARPEIEWGMYPLLGRPIYDLITDESVTTIAIALLGPKITAHGDYWVRPNMAGDPDSALDWHQDSHYYGGTTDGFRVITVWIPLVDVDEHNGCLQVIPGSHKLGKVAARRNERGRWSPEDAIERLGEVRGVPMRRGDVLVLSNLILHATGRNATDQVRWSIDFRYSPAGQNFDWHDMGEGFHEVFPCFLARAAGEEAAESWPTWQARWPAG